ncbi:hypothetical protein AgCh_022349 [Apium graveolens]
MESQGSKRVRGRNTEKILNASHTSDNQGTKLQPFNQSLRTNNAEYLSRNPLKTINGISASWSPLTPLSKNIEFSQNLQYAVKSGSYPINLSGNALSDSSKENQSPIILSTISSLSRSSIEHSQGTKPSSFKHSLRTNILEYLSRNPLKIINAFSGIENRYLKHTELQDINVELFPVVGNYQSSDKDRLATRQMLMSSLHEVQVDSNFQPSFEKLGEFNNVEDCDSSDSDCISSGDCDDVDVHEFENTVTKWSEYLDVGDPYRICSKCQTIMWNHERNNKSATKKPPTFSLYCKNGQIILEKEKQPPEPLTSLLTGGSRFRHFKKNIRMYNCMFAMSSIGGQNDRSINRGGAPYCFKVKGINYHSMGSFVPLDGEIPKFCQLYIYDTEDEVRSRINAVKGGRDAVDEDIVQSLLEMLDKHNHLVKGFRMTRERISQNTVDEFRLVLISSSSAAGRPNHIGPSNEVVGLIVTDEYAKGCRDTIIHSRTNGLKRIFKTDPRFMQLQYHILFFHGDIGYYRQIPLNIPNQKNQKQRQNTENEYPDEKGEREFITMKEYYNYKLMIRPSEGLTPHLGGLLWQQYVVDAFTAIEQYRLDWIRGHQTTIHSDMYHNIRDALNKGDSNPEIVGKATILPASFTGSKRYMNQYFKDAMAICRTLGHPSLFLTMITNTKWSEIQRMLKFLPGIDVVDAPDVVTRVFKMKVDQLLDQIKNKNCFGCCIGVMHVIEFQKRGLPHAHMLIWLHPNDRPKTTEQIDKMVSAEIPDPSIDPVGYEAVKNYMIHGPCGTDCVKSSCMVKGCCIKHFPKRYNSHTYFGDCGFPIYKRRKTGITVKKKGIDLDNRIKGAVCFEDLKTVNDHVYNSFHEACGVPGILQNDQQWHEAIDTDSELAVADLLKSGSGVRFMQTNTLFHRFTIFVMSSVLSLRSILDAHKLTGPNLAIFFRCNKLGHWKRNYKVYLAELKKKKGSKTTASDSGMFMIEVNMSLGQISTWVLDTACGSHICNSLQGLKGSRTLEKDEMILRMGNGARVAAISVGSFSLHTSKTIILNNCYCVPSIVRNIVSIPMFDVDGFSFIIKNNECSILRDNVLFGRGILNNGLLGHISENRLRTLHKERLLDPFDFESYPTCESCLLGKMTRSPFSGHEERAADFLGLVHTDVCGPISTQAMGGFSYFITFIDDRSRFGYVYLMKHKSEVFEKFKEYKHEVEK